MAGEKKVSVAVRESIIITAHEPDTGLRKRLQGKRLNMECTLLKRGVLQKGSVTATLERNGTIVLIKEVPDEACTNCGHYYPQKKLAPFLRRRKFSTRKGSGT